MLAEECWTRGLHEPVQSKNGYSRTITSVSSLCFESRVITSSASCIPLILLPVYSTILVYASDICLAAQKGSLELGYYPVSTHGAGRSSVALPDCRQTWANSAELYVSKVSLGIY